MAPDELPRTSNGARQSRVDILRDPRRALRALNARRRPLRAGRTVSRTDGHDPSAAGPHDQPDRGGRGRRASGGGAQELIENSIDAARRVSTVDLAGGIKASASSTTAAHRPQDLALAIARHATSKVGAPADLEAIDTLGFRGEALASIAAVSRLALSRANGRPHAWRISRRRNRAPIAPAALSAGTSITVEELYFNTPARRKFLRTDATEWAHCEEAFTRLALAHPETGFTLVPTGA